MSYNTYITYNGDGSTTDFAIPFTYLKQEDVVVSRQNGPVSFVFLSPNIIRLNTAVDVGDILTIERRTDIFTPNVVFNNGSSFTGDNINNSLDQIRFAVQEAVDRTGTVYARVYDIASFDSLFNGSLQLFSLNSGGANLGEKITDPGFWQVSLNGLDLELGLDYTILLEEGLAKIKFTEPPKLNDNSKLRFIRFYDGAGSLGGGASNVLALDDLEDVTVSEPVTGQILVYNGTQWVNASGSGGTGGEGTGGGLGGIDIVTSTPTSCSIEGKPIYNSTDGKLYICKNGAYVDIFAAYTPDAPDGIEIVTSTPTSCSIEGKPIYNSVEGKLYICKDGAYVPVYDENNPDLIQIVTSTPTSCSIEGKPLYNSTDGRMYICKDGVYVDIFDAYTPDAPNGIAIVDTLPATGVEGEIVFNRADNKLYRWTSGAWVSVVAAIDVASEVADGSINTAKFAAGIRPVEIVSSLPTTGNFEGRFVYLTTDDKMYRYTGSAFISSVNATDLTGQIGADQIAANAITVGKIAAGAISASEIAAGAINTAKLAAGSITTEKIAALAVTANNIAAGAITTEKLSANSITAGKIQAAAIGTAQLSAGAVTTEKLAAGSIIAEKISALSVTANAIASGAITADKIAANSITTGKIQAAAIGTTQLAAEAVTADKLAANQVLIGSAQIADASITTLKVAGNAITVPSSYSLNANFIPIGEDVSDNGVFLDTYGNTAGEWVSSAPSGVSQNNLIVITGRTGVNGTMNPSSAARRYALFAKDLASSTWTLVYDSGWSPFIGDYISNALINTIPAGTTVTYKVKIMGRGYVFSENTTILRAAVSMFGAKR